MNCVSRRRVVIFAGAGFSHFAEAPLMREFYDAAKKDTCKDIFNAMAAGYYFIDYALNGRRNPNIRPDMETAFGAIVFREAVFGSAYRVASDGGITSAQGPTLGESVMAFKVCIGKLYGQRVLRQTHKWKETYCNFFQDILHHCDIGVITTNYDLVTEEVLCALGRKYDYGLQRRPSVCLGANEPVPILKLHGSVNWSLLEGPHPQIVPHAKPVGMPYVLPPTWNKDMREYRPLTAVWRNAVELLRLSETIMVIGHSLPTTDAHLQFLFADGLTRLDRDSPQKSAVIVDACARTATRVKETLSQMQCLRRGTFVMRRGRTFKEFAKEVHDNPNLLTRTVGKRGG